MTFTIEEIKKAWEAYDKGNVFSIYKDGKWEVPDKFPQGPLESVKAALRPTKDAYEFPEFLEKKWTR